jgi:surface protein
MSSESMTEWPTDILLQLLQALASLCDANAQRVWHQLAFLTCKRDGLAHRAKRMPRPILLRIQISAAPVPVEQNKLRNANVFKIPFLQATVVCVDVDWGDGCVDALREKGEGYVEHTYASEGEYAVRIFPAEAASSGSGERTYLDHLGFQQTSRRVSTFDWWHPLREIVSLGKCGVRSLSYLFAHSKQLRVDLRRLDVSKMSNLCGLFNNSSEFNQPIDGWDVSNVINMRKMFNEASHFDQPIGSWDVSNVVDFTSTKFNQPIGEWNVGNGRHMAFMFGFSPKFNQPIGSWNVGKVTDMQCMFHGALSFNQPIGEWNVRNVTCMKFMFYDAKAFNQPIGNWDVGRVTDMGFMFFCASSFNQPISSWDVRNVKYMILMFSGASQFKQTAGDVTTDYFTSSKHRSLIPSSLTSK